MAWRFLPFFLLCSLVHSRGAGPVMPMVNQQGKITVAATRSVQMKFAIIEYDVAEAAEATATITNGFVTAISVTNGGAGYTVAPVVVLAGGGGTGAKAVAAVSAGQITQIDVHSAGSHYTTAPEVIIAAPPTKPSVTTLWSNDNTSVAGSEPDAGVTIQVSGGTFAALLGYTGLQNMAALPFDVLSHLDARVRVWYRANGAAYKRLPVDNPLQQPVYAQSAGYAASAGSVVDGSVTTSSFAPGVINSIQAAPFQNIEFPSLTTDSLTIPTFSSGTFAQANPFFTARDSTGGAPGELLLVTNVFGNSLALQNTNEGGFSAVTFRSPSGAEHGAFGIGGNSVSGAFEIYRRNLYIEATDANLEGWSPSLVVNQETTYGGTRSFANNIRLLLNSDDGFLVLIPRGVDSNVSTSNLEAAGMWFFDPDNPIFTGYPQAEFRGADANWSVFLRSPASGINGNDYSCIAGTLSESGGHRFYVGGKQTTLAAEIAADRTSISNVFHLTPQPRPANGTEGDVYQDSADHHFYIYNGADWRQLDN